MSFLTIVAIFLGVSILLLAPAAIRGYRRWRGTRIVTCPETGRLEAVEIDPLRAASAAIEGRTELELQSCSRWPERADCAQLCLSEIEEAPDGCLLKSLLQKWYDERPCTLCGKPFGEIHWHDHKPGLLDPAGKPHLWADMPPEKLAETLETATAICWNCKVALDFRQRYPDLVTDRDWKSTE